MTDNELLAMDIKNAAEQLSVFYLQVKDIDDKAGTVALERLTESVLWAINTLFPNEL